MTATGLIERTDALFPNVFPFPMKVRWLWRLDAELCRDIFARYGDAPVPRDSEMTAADRELLLGEEFSDLYISYLTMKMELHSGNITGYVNAAALYNSAYLSFMQHYNRTHVAKGAKISID